VALVVGGKVYTAPTIISEITGGTLEIILDSTTARSFLAELTNEWPGCGSAAARPARVPHSGYPNARG
jgi:hypothetical protein